MKFLLSIASAAAIAPEIENRGRTIRRTRQSGIGRRQGAQLERLQALNRQERFVNTCLAQHALALLARLFRYGEISHHGGFVDVAGRRCVPPPIDLVPWRRMRRLKKQAQAKQAA
jgi:hypothetical protein